jgi:hypothetical protein
MNRQQGTPGVVLTKVNSISSWMEMEIFRGGAKAIWHDTFLPRIQTLSIDTLCIKETGNG